MCIRDSIISESIMSCKIASGLADLVLNTISAVLVNYTNEEYETVRKPAPIKQQGGGSNEKTLPPPNNFTQELDDLPL